MADEPLSISERHVRHYSNCNCLANTDKCCVPTCPCHADQPLTTTDHRIWTGQLGDGTWILVNLWHGEQLDVAFRDEQWHTWGPPVELVEVPAEMGWLRQLEDDRWSITDRD